MVVHAVGPVWQKIKSNEKIMTKCVYAILSEADIKHFQTVAIPALSTGTSKYPIDEAANTIALAVRGYFRKYPDSSLKTVYLCDIAAKVADIFVNAASRIFKSSDKRPTTSRGGRDGLTGIKFTFIDFYHPRGFVSITTAEGGCHISGLIN